MYYYYVVFWAILSTTVLSDSTCNTHSALVITVIDIMHKIQSVQTLMSVMMIQMVVFIHVQTLLEGSFVDVILMVIHWMMMGLLVMVCRSCI